MKYVAIPQATQTNGQPITINGAPTTGHAIMRLLVMHAINTQRSFTTTADGLRLGVKIEAALDLACPIEGDGKAVLTLEDAHWSALRPCVESPEQGYPLTPARLLLPFVDAIVLATEQEPA